MTRKELIDYCLTFPGTYEDYPFDETTTVMKHSGNKKMFAAIAERNGILTISLKCDPMRAGFLRSIYKSVTPAWHFNKTHWNGIEMGGDVGDEELRGMIQHSFDLTKSKTKKFQSTSTG